MVSERWGGIWEGEHGLGHGHGWLEWGVKLRTLIWGRGPIRLACIFWCLALSVSLAGGGDIALVLVAL